jgi:hypothetical protein
VEGDKLLTFLAEAEKARRWSLEAANMAEELRDVMIVTGDR